MLKNEEFNQPLCFGRIVHELTKKIEKVIKTRSKRNPKYNKTKFFIDEKDSPTFPLSEGAFYNYNGYVNSMESSGEPGSRKLKSMDLQSFYKICTYTDVSADYYLGFINSKRKEASAQKVKKEFGLSDTAMKHLRMIKDREAEYRGEITSDVINFILENEEFLTALDKRLPLYFSFLHETRADDVDITFARYGVLLAFEKLVDDLCDHLIASPGENAKTGITYI